ncbi:phosphoadenosine phosphosulfate reductase family protein [Paenibacillus hodogayensis]|uniref:Phosphoadenosine phosphosulfate reductase family protein n=1 Tax=Paenibacillus hodogayensis TaxID=279208 RepID=A0ABV5W5M8_9BACL
MHNTRHILNISGGKDSTALAVFMKQKRPEIEMEYVFCDTQKELPETYEYLDKIEAYLGKPIVRLNDDRGFDHWLQVYGGLLPSSQARWCTRKLKIEPLEDYVGTDEVISYVAIRADEDRSGYVSTKPNLTPVFPFKEHGITKSDVYRILEESGLGLPKYYEWRSRSGCYFCFYQRRSEWVGLLDRHPDLFEKSKEYEKIDSVTGQRFTWSQRESLEELEQPERKADILKRAAEQSLDKEFKSGPKTLGDLINPDDEDELGCLICHL